MRVSDERETGYRDVGKTERADKGGRVTALSRALLQLMTIGFN